MGTIAENPPQPPTYPLSAAEFEFALRRGLGRALIHAGRVSLDAAHVHALYTACTTCLIYDPQCERSRERWLLTIAEVSGSVDVAVRAACDRLSIALANDAPERDWLHAGKLAAAITKAGHADLRSHLYGLLPQWTSPDDTLGACDIVALDGAAGLLRVAERIGELLAVHERVRPNVSPLHQYDEAFGDGAALALLHAVSTDNALIRLFCDRLAVRNRKRRSNAERAALRAADLPDDLRPVERISLSDLVSLIDRCPRRSPVSMAGWGATATNGERRALEARLWQEENADARRLLLGAISRVGLLTFSPLLLDWMGDADVGLRRVARWAASHTRHPDARAFALRSAERGCDHLTLFEANFEPGDEMLLARSPLPADDPHHAFMTMISLAEKHPAADWTAILVHCYANTPCTMCRGNAVKALLARNALPDWVREECVADAEEDVRKMVSSAP